MTLAEAAAAAQAPLMAYCHSGAGAPSVPRLLDLALWLSQHKQTDYPGALGQACKADLPCARPARWVWVLGGLCSFRRPERTAPAVASVCGVQHARDLVLPANLNSRPSLDHACTLATLLKHCGGAARRRREAGCKMRRRAPCRLLITFPHRARRRRGGAAGGRSRAGDDGGGGRRVCVPGGQRGVAAARDRRAHRRALLHAAHLQQHPAPA